MGGHEGLPVCNSTAMYWVTRSRGSVTGVVTRSAGLGMTQVTVMVSGHARGHMVTWSHGHMVTWSHDHEGHKDHMTAMVTKVTMVTMVTVTVTVVVTMVTRRGLV
eukprot:2740288-Rhodomonas_salina.1